MIFFFKYYADCVGVVYEFKNNYVLNEIEWNTLRVVILIKIKYFHQSHERNQFII